jgi:hypothetical protein
MNTTSNSWSSLNQGPISHGLVVEPLHIFAARKGRTTVTTMLIISFTYESQIEMIWYKQIFGWYKCIIVAVNRFVCCCCHSCSSPLRLIWMFGKQVRRIGLYGSFILHHHDGGGAVDDPCNSQIYHRKILDTRDVVHQIFH